MPELIRITLENCNLIRLFLDNAGDSLISFRYFNSREINIVNNHIITYLLKVNGIISGYGHLEIENDKVWLGLAVIEQQKGKGYGKYLIIHLLEFARLNNIISINLTVDISNTTAFNLYKKYGFKVVKEQNGVFYMNYNLS